MLRTEDYLFRYDADCHWLARTVPPLEWKPVRRAVGRWLLGSTNLINAFGRTSRIMTAFKRRADLVCDIFVPQRNFEAFFDWYHTYIDHWPLWVAPYRPPEPYPSLAPDHADRMEDDLYIDCAVYGAPNNHRDRDLSEELEQAVFELDGVKTLIGRTTTPRIGSGRSTTGTPIRPPRPNSTRRVSSPISSPSSDASGSRATAEQRPRIRGHQGSRWH